MGPQSPRLIVGITGASGSLYGIRILHHLRELDVETHLIVSPSALLTMRQETGMESPDLYALASQVHNHKDISAAVASGSFSSAGMVIAPCSIRSMSEIANGITGNLLTRAADVCLKEKRRLVMMVRETPLHSGHLRNMLALSDMGAVIAPPVPAFYNHPASLQEMVDHSVGRVLDLFGLASPFLKRWEGMNSGPSGMSPADEKQD